MPQVCSAMARRFEKVVLPEEEGPAIKTSFTVPLSAISLAMAVIWEDKDDTPSLFSNLRNLISDATGTLKELGCGDAIIKRRGMVAIDRAKVSCDYYRWLSGDIDAVNEYNGDFMLPYEWAEFVMGGFDDYDYED